MQEVNLDDMGFSNVASNEVNPTDLGLEVNPTDLGLDTTEVTQPTNPIQGPRNEMATDVYRKVLSETGDKVEAQEAMTDWKRDKHGIGTTFGGGDQRSKDIALGMQSTLAGLGQTGIDIANLVGFDVSELDEKAQKTIKDLNSKIQDKDFFSGATLGKLIPTLATLPVTFSSKLLAFTLEGAIGYAEARGSEANKIGASISGLISGGGTAAVMKAFEMLGTKGQKVLNELTKEFDLDPATADNIYANFAKATGKELNQMTNYDKAVAIMAQGDKKGAEYFTIAAKADTKAKEALDELSKSRGKAIENQIGSNKVDDAIKPIQEQRAFAEGRYNEVKEIATEMGPEKIQVPIDDFKTIMQDIPENFTSALTNKVKRLLENSDGNVTMSELFDIREAMNGQTIKIRKANKKDMVDIDAQKFIDNLITDNMPENFKPLWETSRAELALSYAMRGGNKKADVNNAFGTLLSEAGKPIDTRAMTYSDILDKIAKTSGGGKEMNQMLKTIGSENMEKFEKGLVSEIYRGGDITLDKVLKQLDHVEMTTPEGIRLKKNLKMLDKAFSADDFYQVAAEAWRASDRDGTAITANLLSKLKYTVMGQVWTKVAKKFLPTQEGQQLRHLNRVIKAIKESKPIVKDIGNLTPVQASEFEGVIRESIQSTIDAEIGKVKNELDVKKLPGGTGQVNDTQQTIDLGSSRVPPIQVTPEGKAVENIMDYDVRNVVRNLFLDIPEDKVVKSVEKFMPTERRIQNIMGNYNKEIQSAVGTMDRAKGYKVARNIVEQEANTLIKNIEKDLGVKFPKAEADKLIMMKIKEMIDACK